MTAAAREVLADCHVALRLLEEETELGRWRVHWAGAVALTRAVGHVLDKVDGRNPRIRAAARSAYGRWRAEGGGHEIFREFIDRERNSILKEYRFSHHPLDEVSVVVAMDYLDPSTGDRHRSVDVVPVGDNIYRPMLEGYRKGDDARDILTDALSWWAVELDAIDAASANPPSDH